MLDFRPPSFVRPQEYPDFTESFGKSLDTIFNAYLLSQQQKRQNAQDLLNYGLPLGRITEKQVAAAQGPAQPQEEPGVLALRNLIQQHVQQRGLGIEKSQAEINKLNAEAGFQNKLSESISGTPSGGAGPQTIDIGGVPHVITITRSGVHYQAIPPAETTFIDTTTGEEIKLPRGTKPLPPSPGAQQAVQNIGKIDSFLNVVAEQEKTLKSIPSGRISGTIADVANRLTGVNPEITKARGLSGIMVPLTARLLGGDVGNLSEYEQQRVIDLIPKLNGTVAERQIAIDTLRTLLQEKKHEQNNIIEKRTKSLVGRKTKKSAPKSDNIPVSEKARPSVESIVKEGRSNGLSRDQIKKNLQKAGY